VNTIFDTCVSFTFIATTLDPLVAKNGSKQVNNTQNLALCAVAMATGRGNRNKFKHAFKIAFVYLQKI